MFESYEVPRQVFLFEAAIKLLAHKDITPDRAVKLALEVESKVLKECEVPDVEDELESIERKHPF